MEERIIVFKDSNEEIVISTNAPVEEIQKALVYRNKARKNGLFEWLCDFEIIQEYLENRNYIFNALDTREIYYW